MKTRPVEAELFYFDGRTDGWTDRQTERWANRNDKAKVDFHTIANATKNVPKISSAYRGL